MGLAWQAHHGQLSVLPSKAAKARRLPPPSTWVSGTCRVQSEGGGGGQQGAARAWGRWNRSRWHRLAALVSMDCPGSVPGQQGAEKLLGGGRQHLGDPQALGDAGLMVGRGLQEPSHTWPACLRAGQWQDFHQEGGSCHPRSGSLGPGV